MLRVVKARLWPAVIFLIILSGCLGAPMAPMEQAPPPPPAPAPAAGGQPDQALLEDALRGRTLGNAEVVNLSDRLLAEGNPALSDEKTMARLEILLLKAQKNPDKVNRPVILRNLGIVHFHQGQYKKARQELQDSNELNPKDARTHYYLARLFVQQGEIYQKQGKQKLSRQQFKRAAIEMEQARKLAPGNPTYKQELQPVKPRGQGR
jgi:tetratricopeptide (TPR) repeat protein